MSEEDRVIYVILILGAIALPTALMATALLKYPGSRWNEGWVWAAFILTSISALLAAAKLRRNNAK